MARHSERDRSRSAERERRGRASRSADGRRRSSRSRTPPARPSGADQADGRQVAWTRDNMELMLVNGEETIKLVEVERLLIAHNRSSSAVRRGEAPALTVLKGLLILFKASTQYHLATVARYKVVEGEDTLDVEVGLSEPDYEIRPLSVSNRNLFEDGEWEQQGQAELARLQKAYLDRHGRGLPLQQAAAVAWRRSAALSWFSRYRSDEEGLAVHLDRLLDDLRDKRELQRMARRFEVAEPAEARAAAAGGGGKAGAREGRAPASSAGAAQAERRGAEPARRGREAEQRGRQGQEEARQQRQDKDKPAPQKQQQQQPPKQQQAEQSRRQQQDRDKAQQQEQEERGRAPRPAAGKGVAAAAAGNGELPPHLSGRQPNQQQQQAGQAASRQQAALLPAQQPTTAVPAAQHPASKQRQQQQGGAGQPSSKGPTAGVAASREEQLQAALQASRDAKAEVRKRRAAAASEQEQGRAVTRATSGGKQGQAEAAPASGAAAADAAAAAAGAKRKRSAILWEPQPQEEGDESLQPLDARIAAAKGGVKAAPPSEPAPKAKQQKADKGGSAAAAGAAAAAIPVSPKGFTITVRNTPPLEGSPSLSEEGQLAEPAWQRQGGGPGPSRLASGSLGAEPAHLGRRGGGADWQQQQQHGQAYPPHLEPAGRDRAGTPDAMAFPPGFGGGADGAWHDAGPPAQQTVRVTMQQQQQHQQLVDFAALQLAAGGMAGAAAGVALPAFAGGLVGGEAGFLPQQQQPPAYHLPMALPGHDRYVAGTAAAAAAGLSPSPADVFQLAAASPHQHRQQQFFGAPAGEFPAGFAGMAGGGMGGFDSMAAAAGYDASPRLSQDGHRMSGQHSGGGGGRRVEVEAGSGGGGQQQQRQGKGAGGKGGGVSGGAASWDPVAVWEAGLIEILRRRTLDGVPLGELREQHPLPACMKQTLGAYGDYLSFRKQLCSVQRNQKGTKHDQVVIVPGADAWVQYKRSLLQLLADRRPRLDAGMVQRTLPPPARLNAFLLKDAERSFVGFVAKYLRDEVAVLKGSEPGSSLLELRPFRGAGPALQPPFSQPCRAFASSGRCQYGDQCYHSHAQPRPYISGE